MGLKDFLKTSSIFSFFLMLSFADLFAQDCKEIVYNYQKKMLDELDVPLPTFEKADTNYANNIYQYLGNHIDTSHIYTQLIDLINIHPDEISPLENPRVYWMINAYTNSVMPYFKNIFTENNTVVCFGSLPTNQIEAYNDTTIDSNHRIIIFNRRLLDFIKAIVDITVYAEVESKKNNFRNISSLVLTEFNNTLKYYLSNNSIDTYAHFSYPFSFRNEPLTAHDYDLKTILLSGCFKFIICHELAHAALQHKFYSSKLSSEIWREEFEADNLGYMVFSKSILDNPENAAIAETYLAVPLFLFSALHIYSQSRAVINNHPEKILKLENAIKLIKYLQIDTLNCNWVSVDTTINNKSIFSGGYPQPYIRSVIIEKLIKNNEGTKKIQNLAFLAHGLWMGLNNGIW